MYWFSIFQPGVINISATGTEAPPNFVNQWCIHCGKYTYHTSGGCTECHKKLHITENKWEQSSQNR